MVPPYPEKLFKSIGRVLVYKSRIEKTVDVQVWSDVSVPFQPAHSR